MAACSCSLALIKLPQQSPVNPSPLKPNRLRCSASLLRPAAVTLTAAAALLLSRFPSPPLALASPPPSQTLNLTTSTDDDLESLRSLLDQKIKSDDLADAVSILDSLAELEPDNPEHTIFKAHLFIQSGDPVSAKHVIEQVISTNPFSVEAYNALIVAHREAEESMESILPRIDSAIAMCKKEKRLEDLRDFKLLKAQVLVVERKYEEAIRVYEELVKEEPKDFRPYLCEGIVYSMMKKKDKAEEKFEKYRRLVPRDHPYAGFFDDNVVAMKVFGAMQENQRKKEELKI